MTPPRAAQTKRPPSGLYRALVWGLLLFCISFAMIGSVIAEHILGALNCQPGADGRAGTCPFFVNVLASRLTLFLSAQTPLDNPFLLLHSFWALILVWLAIIGLSRYAYQNPRPITVRLRAPVPAAMPPLRRLHHVLQGSFWLLLMGLIAFCIAFGTPFLGTHVSREILQTLNCSPGSFDPMSSACMSAPGFWTPRLQPFLIPIVGQVGSPFWLFRQFGDVLIIWCIVIAAVLALKAYVARRIAAKVS